MSQEARQKEENPKTKLVETIISDYPFYIKSLLKQKDKTLVFLLFA